MQQVIFIKNDGIHKIDDIKNVASGYFRYLMRYDKAVPASSMLVEAALKRKEERRAEMLAQQKEAKGLLIEIQKKTYEFTEKADGEHLYGSINEQKILDVIKEKLNVELKKEQIHMGEHIKTTGEHQVKLHLADKVDGYITVIVKAEGDLDIDPIKEMETPPEETDKKEENTDKK